MARRAQLGCLRGGVRARIGRTSSSSLKSSTLWLLLERAYGLAIMADKSSLPPPLILSREAATLLSREAERTCLLDALTGRSGVAGSESERKEYTGF